MTTTSRAVCLNRISMMCMMVVAELFGMVIVIIIERKLLPSAMDYSTAFMLG